MQNVVLHLDMNSYFASCEQQDNPIWRGKPVGVCEHLGGIVIGASIEAKRWGITTGTPVWEARKLYPKIILTHTHPDRYRFYTKRLIKLVSDYTDKVEVYSIDEVFLDLTRVCNINVVCHSGQAKARVGIHDSLYGSRNKCGMTSGVNPFEEAVNIAKEIKRRMKKEVGDWLKCSIGIASNKLLAKIASEMKKPDGLTVIRNPKFEFRNPNQILNHKSKLLNSLPIGNEIRFDNLCLEFTKDELYHKLKLTDVPGIGSRMEKRLNTLGIRTLLDLKNCPKSLLTAHFGNIVGYHLYNMGQLQGTWKEEFEGDEKIKSLGHMYTLPKEFRKSEHLLPVLYKLSEMVARRLRRQRLMGNILHFHIHDETFQCFGKSHRLGFFLSDGREIFLQAAKIFESLQIPSAVFKLIGITVAGLVPFCQQLTLFGEEEKSHRIAIAMDKINQKYGDFTLCRAAVLKAGQAFRDSVGFGRVRELNEVK